MFGSSFKTLTPYIPLSLTKGEGEKINMVPTSPEFRDKPRLDSPFGGAY